MHILGNETLEDPTSLGRIVYIDGCYNVIYTKYR